MDDGDDDIGDVCAISINAWIHLSLQTCYSHCAEEKIKARGHHPPEVAVIWTELKLKFRPLGLGPAWSSLEKGQHFLHMDA